MNSQFQQTLKNISFTTYHRNQLTTYGYDDMFANRRVIVFSVPQYRTISSSRHLQDYIDNADDLLNNGIDDLCAIDSTDWLIGPMMDKKSKIIKGLPDRDSKFIVALAEHYNYQKPVGELSRLWQYVTIINNGEPEKLWHNPFRADTKLVILKDNEYRYRKLSADMVLKYLVDKQT